MSDYRNDKIVTSQEEFNVKPIVLNEPLMLIVNALPTVGLISKANPNEASIELRKPVLVFKGDRVVIFKKYPGNQWRISGYGIVK